MKTKPIVKEETTFFSYLRFTMHHLFNQTFPSNACFSGDSPVPRHFLLPVTTTTKKPFSHLSHFFRFSGLTAP